MIRLAADLDVAVVYLVVIGNYADRKFLFNRNPVGHFMTLFGEFVFFTGDVVNGLGCDLMSPVFQILHQVVGIVIFVILIYRHLHIGFCLGHQRPDQTFVGAADNRD